MFSCLTFLPLTSYVLWQLRKARNVLQLPPKKASRTNTLDEFIQQFLISGDIMHVHFIIYAQKVQVTMVPLQGRRDKKETRPYATCLTILNSWQKLSLFYPFSPFSRYLSKLLTVPASSPSSRGSVLPCPNRSSWLLIQAPISWPTSDSHLKLTSVRKLMQYLYLPVYVNVMTKIL